MEIGLSTNQLLEIGLNMAGFITAGVLIFVIQSLFRRDKRKPASMTTAKTIAIDEPMTGSETIPERPEKPGRNTEFVSLSGSDWKPRVSVNTKKKNVVNDRKTEVINLARGMINRSGQTEAIPGNFETNRLPSINRSKQLQTSGRK